MHMIRKTGCGQRLQQNISFLNSIEFLQKNNLGWLRFPPTVLILISYLNTSSVQRSINNQNVDEWTIYCTTISMIIKIPKKYNLVFGADNHCFNYLQKKLLKIFSFCCSTNGMLVSFSINYRIKPQLILMLKDCKHF